MPRGPFVSEGEVKNALRVILNNDQEPSLNWCVDYARYCLTLDKPSDIRHQLMYVITNMTRWRGPEAKRVRETLKAYLFQK